jgi:glucose-6-phosphate 1-epimerase
MDADLQILNENYTLPGQLSFHEVPGGMAAAVMNNRFGTAVVTLAGAHVLSYRPHGGREVLWSSPSAAYELSLDMRGGIPLCWPWFGRHPQDTARFPIHGILRAQVFAVRSALVLEDGATRLTLTTRDTPTTRALWPHAYEMDVEITLGQSLSVEWRARNRGAQPFTCTGALHPYFAVSNVHDVTLRGLDGLAYLDTMDGCQSKLQAGWVTFPEGIDNIYLDTTSELALEDPGYQRTIYLRKTGSRTTVVWNPYHDDASSPDIGAGQHRYFLCVESANAAGDIITIAPGAEARLGMEIEIGKMSEA